MIGIYVYTNNITKKKYTGQSWDIEKRLSQHEGKGNSGSRLLQNSLRKYGRENFSVQKIPVPAATQKLLNKAEVTVGTKMYNTLHPNGYNLSFSGSNGKLSEKNKKDISNTLKGRYVHNKGKTTWNKGKTSWNKGKKLSRSWKDIEKITQDRINGMSIVKLAKKYGCARNTMEKILKENNITLSKKIE